MRKVTRCNSLNSAFESKIGIAVESMIAASVLWVFSPHVQHIYHIFVLVEKVYLKVQFVG